MDPDFDDFVRATQASLVRFGLAMTGNPHDAADLAQSALERVGMRWSRVRQMEHPAAYTKTVMARQHATRWRRLRRESLQVSPAQASYRDVSSPADSAMWAALATLPPRQRAVLVLRYYEDLTEAEIAEVLGCRPGTVKSQAHRALAALRSRYADPTGKSGLTSNEVAP